MITQDTIHLLVEAALQNYLHGIKPDPFAAIAAYEVAMANADQWNKASADIAATVAASSFIDSSVHAVEQSIFVTRIHEAMRAYRLGKREASQADPFSAMILSLNKFSITQEAHALYDNFSDEANSEAFRQAKEAALNVYMHAYTCSRAAYTHAVSVAARYSEEESRNQVFKEAISGRLEADLLCQPVAPSFILKILCSDAMKIAAAVVLIAALAALTLGVCGLAIASLGVSLAGTAALLTTSGAIASTASAGFLTAGFFAKKQWDQDQEKSSEAVQAINNVEQHAVSPT